MNVPASANFNHNHAQGDNQDRSRDQPKGHPCQGVVLAEGAAGISIPVASCSASQKQSKVGQMVGFPAQLIVLASVREALILANPFGFASVIVTQTDVSVLERAGLVGSGEANDQRSVQFRD